MDLPQFTKLYSVDGVSELERRAIIPVKHARKIQKKLLYKFNDIEMDGIDDDGEGGMLFGLFGEDDDDID